jgi:hypothetical protein
MDGVNDERREYRRLAEAICVVRHEIEALPPWADEMEPYRQNREELYERCADLERQLAVLSPWARERAAVPAVAAAEVVADEPFLATASRSAQ